MSKPFRLKAIIAIAALCGGSRLFGAFQPPLEDEPAVGKPEVELTATFSERNRNAFLDLTWNNSEEPTLVVIHENQCPYCQRPSPSHQYLLGAVFILQVGREGRISIPLVDLALAHATDPFELEVYLARSVTLVARGDDPKDYERPRGKFLPTIVGREQFAASQFSTELTRIAPTGSGYRSSILQASASKEFGPKGMRSVGVSIPTPDLLKGTVVVLRPRPLPIKK